MADWTVDEVRAYLPRLRSLIEIVRHAAVVSARARSNGHRDTSSGAEDAGERSAGEPTAGERTAVPEAPSEEATAPVEALSGVGPAEALAEIEDRGIVLRDLERGLVDFPSRHPGGRQVLLCWQLGEPDLAWWHLPEDGFAGRRPLPLPPQL